MNDNLNKVHDQNPSYFTLNSIEKYQWVLSHRSFIESSKFYFVNALHYNNKSKPKKKVNHKQLFLYGM